MNKMDHSGCGDVNRWFGRFGLQIALGCSKADEVRSGETLVRTGHHNVPSSLPPFLSFLLFAFAVSSLPFPSFLPSFLPFFLLFLVALPLQ